MVSSDLGEASFSSHYLSKYYATQLAPDGLTGPAVSPTDLD
jgi:hypothetical protein